MRTLRTEYVVKTSSSKMPPSCWGRYEHSAVLLVDTNLPPPYGITTHAQGCLEVVYDSDAGFKGTSKRCAAAKNRKYCEELCALLNAGMTLSQAQDTIITKTEL